jgi:hypothetical protein
MRGSISFAIFIIATVLAERVASFQIRYNFNPTLECSFCHMKRPQRNVYRNQPILSQPRTKRNFRHVSISEIKNSFLSFMLPFSDIDMHEMTQRKTCSHAEKKSSLLEVLLKGLFIKVVQTIVAITICCPKSASASLMATSIVSNEAVSGATSIVSNLQERIFEAIQFLVPDASRSAKEAFDSLPPLNFLPRLLGQLVIALAAYRVSTFVAWGVRGYCAENHIDLTTAIFLAELLRYGTLLLASIVLFQAFGIQTPQSFTAIVTSLTLAIGLSFQSVLSNFAAGIMLLVFRPYSVGDKVKIGNKIGFVYDISLLATRVDTEDNIRIQVPNSQILNGVVENYTLNPLRRVEVMVTVSSKADIRKTREVIEAAIAPFAYLGIAGSTGPAKAHHASPGAAGSAKLMQAVSKTPQPTSAAVVPHPATAREKNEKEFSSTEGRRSLLGLFRSRSGNGNWITPAELVSSLAQQYAQLWKLANGQLRLESGDMGSKKAPGPEVVLREVTAVGLRWQARVWAPSRRCVSAAS